MKTSTPQQTKQNDFLYVANDKKNKLTIHINSNIFDNLTAENLERIDDNEIHLQLKIRISNALSLKDVWLDYFITRQQLISQLKSGDSFLAIKDDKCMDSNGNFVLKFSKAVC